MKIKFLLLAFFITCIAQAQITSTTLGVNNTSSVTTVSGTMLKDSTYKVIGTIEIPIGDTLFLQSNVKVCVENGATIIVKGVLISLGTAAEPNWFTACSVTPIDQVGNLVSSDPAWNGSSGEWTGINCDTSCRLLVLKYTHINYVGAIFPATFPFVGGNAGTTSYGIHFQNANGCFIMEDSWMYGSVDDAVRVTSGKLDIMRNTFEKCGYVGGEANIFYHGSVGDCAYNLYIGHATNGCRASDKGAGAVPQCNVNVYNNTFVDGGYRQASPTSRGSDIDYEQGAKGNCYNNLIVNCRNGIRVGDGENGIPSPDTANLFIGSNYICADSVLEVNQFFPVVAGTWTKPSAYVIPTAVQLSLPAHFYSPMSNPNGDDLTYNDPSLAAANNPLFVNFPLPEPVSGHNLSAIESVATGVAATGNPYDFHLQPTSPAIGIGNGSASYMLNACAAITNPNWGPHETPPCIDMGCFPRSCSLLGTEQIVEQSGIRLYPNPNRGTFTLALANINAACRLDVFNVLGERVLTESLGSASGNKVIDLTGQPSGVYMYRVLTETGNLIGEGKFIVSK